MPTLVEPPRLVVVEAPPPAPPEPPAPRASSTRATPTPAPAPASPPDPVTADVDAVVRLFEEFLGEVIFPDVDACRLRALADEARRLATAVDDARAALEAAERAAAAASSVLRVAAQRGLAYARIYAEADPQRAALSVAIEKASSIDAVVAATPTAAPTGKKRGRPRKAPVDSLFAHAEGGVENPPVPS